MSKTLIFRFVKTDGPGYFGQFLDSKGIKYQLLEVDQGKTIPTSIDGAPALVFMPKPLPIGFIPIGAAACADSGLREKTSRSMKNQEN